MAETLLSGDVGDGLGLPPFLYGRIEPWVMISWADPSVIDINGKPCGRNESIRMPGALQKGYERVIEIAEKILDRELDAAELSRWGELRTDGHRRYYVDQDDDTEGVMVPWVVHGVAISLFLISRRANDPE